jgi:WD40-like Beta Propeller Repeat
MSKLLEPRFAAAVVALGSVGLFGAAALALPNFTDWSSPASIESLPGSAGSLNTPAVDGCVSLSRDGLVMFFNSNRAGNQDIYMARRADTGAGFGTPARLPEPINSAADEFCPTVALGNRLYFSRASEGDPGDLFVSHEGPDGWSEPTPLGAEINSPLMEESATFFEDEQGNPVMLFSRRQASGAGGTIFGSISGQSPVPIAGGPDSLASDNRPGITHDGLSLYFDSTRPGGLGGPDLWVATRASTADEFGPASHLRALSSPGLDARPSISWDGSELFFSSNRTGSESAAPDIWQVSRSKKSGPKTVTF